MANSSAFDNNQAHKHFSASCYNMAWDLIERSDRTPEDDEQMVHLAHASLWHWTQRPDCIDKNLSIGYWQISRVSLLVGDAVNARKYANQCLAKTPEDEPFCLAYAYEALSRAESLADNRTKAKEHLAEAWHNAERVTDDEEKQLLVNDLRTLE